MSVGYRSKGLLSEVQRVTFFLLLLLLRDPDALKRGGRGRAWRGPVGFGAGRVGGLYVVEGSGEVDLAVGLDDGDGGVGACLHNVDVVLFVVVCHHDVVARCEAREVAKRCLQPAHACPAVHGPLDLP